MEYEICVDGVQLEHVSEFKYFGCVLDKSGTDEAVCCKNVVRRRRRVASDIRFLVNVRVLHKLLVMYVIMYGSDTMIWKGEQLCQGVKRIRSKW